MTHVALNGSGKTIKRILITTVIFAVVAIVVVAQSLTLKKVSNREVSYALSEQLKERISKECISNNVDEVVEKSCNLTCELLTFKKNNDIDNGEANCVGYAQLNAAICNYAFSINNISDAKATPVVGKVYLMKTDLNQILCGITPSKWVPFIKDHDFVEIQTANNTYYVDSSLRDLIGSDCKTVK